MISYKQALSLINKNCSTLPSVRTNLNAASGQMLAVDVFSTMNFPSFAQSAMDGYAVRFSDLKKNSTLKIIGEVPAGDVFDGRLQPGEAIRIFTGAAVPAGADTVVIQEKTVRNWNELTVTTPPSAKGANIRKTGSQTKAGEKVLAKNSLLTPAAVGLLSGIGCHHISVFPKPRVGILATGKELVVQGNTLKPGQIYESNSYALSAALRQLHIEHIPVMMATDDEEKIIAAILELLEQSDVLLITGGVSVGDYDFVSGALKKISVQKIFHGVKQKPGKPLYFGKLSQKYIFGLPGNPGSVLTCFYFYVQQAIALLQNKPLQELQNFSLGQMIKKKKGLTHFIKAKMKSGKAISLSGQESYKMNAFAVADALIVLPENEEKFLKGKPVKVLPLLHD